MNKVLNPFEYLSNAKAFGWGFLGLFLSAGLIVLCGGSHVLNADSAVLKLLSGNLLLWFPLSTLLYVAALALSPSRIRAIDIYAMTLFALLPSMLMFGFSNAISQLLQLLVFEPRSLGDVLSSALYNLVVIMLSVSMVWSMVWGCFAYSVAANMKGWRSVGIFITCFVMVSVAIQLLVIYF